VIQTLLPLDAQGLAADDEIFRLTTRGGEFEVERTKNPSSQLCRDMIFEQDPVILDALLPLYLNNQLLRALQNQLPANSLPG